MKILMLCDFYDERLQYQENLLAKYYAKNGHDVTIVASTFRDVAAYCAAKYDRNDPASTHLDGRVKVIRLPYSLNLLNKLRKFGGVGAILRRERPDLIFVHDIHLNLSDAAEHKRRHPGCRIVMDYHADYANSAKNWISLNILHKIIRKAVFWRHRRFIDKIYPVAPTSAVFLNEVYGVPIQEMELFPLGADTDLAKNVMEERAGAVIRKAHGIPDDAIVVFSGGKLTPAKKTHVLVDAFLQIADPSLHLLVVGDALESDGDYGRRLAGRCAGNPRAHFIGWVPGGDVYRYMDACDLAVFPASQSVLWQQALSMGLPLIVGQVGVQNLAYLNVCGNMIILDEEDVRSDVIAARICKLAHDRAALDGLRACALKASEELLNYDKIVSKTLAGM